MKKILTLTFATLLLASCGISDKDSDSCVVNDSISSLESDYQTSSSIEDGRCNLDEFVEDADYSETSDDDYDNNYDVNKNGRGSVMIHDLNGNCCYIDVDGYGNLSAHDLNGNYYHSHTDDFGNTSGYDSNGNYYHSYTDDFGNTSGYDSDGNYYHSHTDDFGNTTGYNSNGNYYSAYSDDFGNTTINVY